MPITVETTGSLEDVKRDLRNFEAEYEMSSEDFIALANPDEVISEFDAIEWSFLLMQKRVLQEGNCSPTSVSYGTYKTKTSTVAEPDMAYDLAA